MTFIIPVKIDNEIRLQNLKKIIEFIENNYQNFELIISEQDKTSKLKYFSCHQPRIHVGFYGKMAFYFSHFVKQFITPVCLEC